MDFATGGFEGLRFQRFSAFLAGNADQGARSIRKQSRGKRPLAGPSPGRKKVAPNTVPGITTPLVAAMSPTRVAALKS